MSRRRLTPIDSLEDRLSKQAICLREEAEALPPGAERTAIERRARQAETGSHISGWLQSNDLQEPK